LNEAPSSVSLKWMVWKAKIDVWYIQIDKHSDEKMDRRTDEQTEGRTDKLAERRTNIQADRWTGGKMNRCTDEMFGTFR
jgi:hypothetical protein